jgi:hypothetical protein
LPSPSQKPKEGPRTHVFLANDFSPVGRHWNPRTFELLRTWLKGKHSSEDVALHQLLLESAKKHLRFYCKGIENVSITADMSREDLIRMLQSQEGLRMQVKQQVREVRRVFCNCQFK